MDIRKLEAEVRKQVREIAQRHNVDEKEIEVAALKEFVIVLKMAEESGVKVRDVVEETLRL